MSAKITIRAEAEGDRKAVWAVNQAAFPSDAEANLVDELRDGGLATVSLVAEVEGKVVGHILFSPLAIITTSKTVQAVSLAPMAVLPSHQRQNVGSKLVETGLNVCREQGHSIAVVLGHPTFYPRFGFSADLATPLANPFGDGEAWMAIQLVPGALIDIKGRVEYPAPFNTLK